MTFTSKIRLPVRNEDGQSIAWNTRTKEARRKKSHAYVCEYDIPYLLSRVRYLLLIVILFHCTSYIFMQIQYMYSSSYSKSPGIATTKAKQSKALAQNPSGEKITPSIPSTYCLFSYSTVYCGCAIAVGDQCKGRKKGGKAAKDPFMWWLRRHGLLALENRAATYFVPLHIHTYCNCTEPFSLFRKRGGFHADGAASLLTVHYVRYAISKSSLLYSSTYVST